jgi:hypothetical protein
MCDRFRGQNLGEIKGQHTSCEDLGDTYAGPLSRAGSNHTYVDFVNFFRGGHTIDDNVDAPAIAGTLAAAMLKSGVASGHLAKLKNRAIPDETLADISLTKSGSQLIQTTLDQAFCELAIAEARKSIAEDDGKPHPYVGVVMSWFSLKWRSDVLR